MASDDSGLPPERQRPTPTIDLKANEVSSRTLGGDKPAPEAEGKPSGAPEGSAAGPDPTTTESAFADARPLHLRPALWAASAAAAIVLFGLGIWLGMSFMNRDDQLSQVAARLGKIEAVLANAPATDTAIKATDTAMKMTAENIAALNKRLDDVIGSIRDARARADNAVTTAEAAQKAAGAAPQLQAGGDTDALSNRIAALSNPPAQASANSPPTTRSAGARWSRRRCATVSSGEIPLRPNWPRRKHSQVMRRPSRHWTVSRRPACLRPQRSRATCRRWRNRWSRRSANPCALEA